jgi:putative transposase
MDIILVSEHDRQPIGRPWVTFAIDIYSRMIHGYYLSLEAPSATSVAMCIANAILPKDDLLAQHDIDSNWDIWGFMDNIHVDNGADFRSETLKKACLIHDIHIDFRPLGKTNYGGHIERLIGTIMAAAHLIPGTTFSSTKEKGSYDPETNASMTFSELEKWLLSFITKIYHKRVHQSIGMTPEEKFIEGVLQGEAAGIPAKPDNPRSIYLNFLPAFERTIQRNGVNIDGLNYYDGVLRPFIHAVGSNGKKKKFIFKRDPKDIAEVWFYNEEDNGYYRIPLADQSIGHLTLFEFNELKRKARERQEKSGRRISEREILMAYDELHEHIEATKKKTKKAKREQERKQVAQKQHERILPKRDMFPEPNTTGNDDLWDNLDDIPDFDVE